MCCMFTMGLLFQSASVSIMSVLYLKGEIFALLLQKQTGMSHFVILVNKLFRLKLCHDADLELLI